MMLELLPQPRHCEERSDEAIQAVAGTDSLDCFASLAMTTDRRFEQQPVKGTVNL